MRSKKNISWPGELTERIRRVRISTFGDRGRAKFARALGISPSTYNYYERGRVPPMPTLLKMAEVSGVDLRWFLTGQLPAGQLGPTTSPAHAKILSRMAALLPQGAEAVTALSALLDLLESQPEAAALPETPETRETSETQEAREAQETSETQEAQETRETQDIPGSVSDGRPPDLPSGTRIPVMGRTAAGVAHFWKHPQVSIDVLQSAIVGGAVSGRPRTATLSDPEDRPPGLVDQRVHLVQLAKPVRIGEVYVAEFLDAPGLQEKWPDAFALRIDGDSMHPSLSHGDLVIVSPSESARPRRPAVVQLRNQIGVTCKLFYKDRQGLHLIPINEQFQRTRHLLNDLVWALAVLYRVRLAK